MGRSFRESGMAFLTALLCATASACAVIRIEDPQACVEDWAAGGAGLARISERYTEALDDSTPASAAYRRMSIQMTRAAMPMLEAFEARFGDTEPCRALVRSLSGGLGGEGLVLQSATEQEQRFSSAEGMDVVFVRRGDGWRIDGLASLRSLVPDNAQREHLVLQQVRALEPRLPRYAESMEEFARRLRAGEFADAEVAGAAIASATKEALAL